jgi:hypothetical protein
MKQLLFALISITFCNLHAMEESSDSDQNRVASFEYLMREEITNGGGEWRIWDIKFEKKSKEERVMHVTGSEMETLDLLQPTRNPGVTIPFESITILRWYYSKLKSVKKNDFIQFPNVEEISLELNAIEEVDSEAFTVLTKLKKVRLDSNCLSITTISLLKAALSNLEFLDCSEQSDPREKKHSESSSSDEKDSPHSPSLALCGFEGSCPSDESRFLYREYREQIARSLVIIGPDSSSDDTPPAEGRQQLRRASEGLILNSDFCNSDSNGEESLEEK